MKFFPDLLNDHINSDYFTQKQWSKYNVVKVVLNIAQSKNTSVIKYLVIYWKWNCGSIIHFDYLLFLASEY